MRAVVGFFALAVCGAAPAASQSAPSGAAGLVPGFWDPQRRYERPNLSANTTIRFLTESDYPPFNFIGPGGALTGFNVDLARVLCEELGVSCTIQMRRFDTLLDSLAGRAGDAVIASIAVTAQTRQRADFTDPYYRTPARFVGRRGAPPSPNPEALAGRRVAVVTGTAHEAFAKAFFPGAELTAYPNEAEALTAVQRGAVDLAFADAIRAAQWLNGPEGAECCAFVGGPFPESRYFGEGVGIAVRRGDDTLRTALNWALYKAWEKGRYAEVWLRYFPVNPF